jgi:hypothetical protein
MIRRWQKSKKRNVLIYPATQYYENVFNLCTVGIIFHKLHKVLLETAL